MCRDPEAQKGLGVERWKKAVRRDEDTMVWLVSVWEILVCHTKKFHFYPMGNHSTKVIRWF